MKIKFLAIIALTVIFSLHSCEKELFFVNGNGEIKTEFRNPDIFYKLENSTSIDIIYKTADTSSITIRADDNLMKYITTEVLENTLEIKYQSGYSDLYFTEKPLITITSPRLESAVIAGTAAFSADKMSGDAVTIKMSGSGDISADQIECKEFSANVTGSGSIYIKDCQSDGSEVFLSGSGNLNIAGRSSESNFKISGSGNINAEKFMLGYASVIISGSGNAYTNIRELLNAFISGGGNIYLKGEPTIRKTISGSGRIINM